MKTLLSILVQLATAVSLSLLTGCKSDPTTGTTQIEGQVVESQSRQPVGKATVQVYLAGKAGGYGPVGNAYPCDATGHFSFDFDAQSKYGYILKAQAPPGYITDWNAAPNLTAGRKNTGLVVPVLAPAWVRLVLVDEPPKSRVIISTQGYEGSGDLLSYPRDTTFIRPTFAGFKTSIAWFINEQGQNRQSYQEIQPHALDTVTVRIPF